MLQHLAHVRQREDLEFFMWKRDPATLIDLAGPCAVVFVTPGHPQGVAILGGGALGAWHSVPLPECGATVPQVVERFRHATLDSGTPTGLRRRAVSDVTAWLADAVWTPLSGALASVDALWLIPCGYLAGLPCHAGRLPDGRIAIERHDLHYAVSVEALAAARRLPRPGGHEGTFVGIPEPVTSDALVGAAAELDRAAAHFGSSRVLLPAEATPTVALEAVAHAGFLHAACHGIADQDAPSDSGLLLQGGRLTVEHLSGLSTGLELAVLSACETYVSAGGGGDDVFSLAAAVHLAGSRAVIGSSWRVPDLATATLMDAFYRYWRAESEPISVALRKAQLDMSSHERWREPYYWAGFSIVGVPIT
jgi:CHAT domain-containing protein